MDIDLSVDCNEKSLGQRDKYLLVARHVKNRFWEARDYKTYLLKNASSYYDGEVVQSAAQSAERLQEQRQSQMFDSLTWSRFSIFCLHMNGRLIRVVYT